GSTRIRLTPTVFEPAALPRSAQTPPRWPASARPLSTSSQWAMTCRLCPEQALCGALGHLLPVAGRRHPLACLLLGVAEQSAQLRQQLAGLRARPVERVDPVEPGKNSSFVHAADA